jgi:hypothetical protein
MLLNYFYSYIWDGKQLRITFKPQNIFVVFEAITNGRHGDNWKSKIQLIFLLKLISYFSY